MGVLKTFLMSLFIALFLNCGQKVQNSNSILNYGNQTEPEDLDPQIITGVPEYHIVSSLFEGLVIPDPKTLAPVPGVATSWDVSSDGLSYTFHIRSNARWSNGDPVTAHDFVFASKRILSPALAAEYAYMQFCIENGEAFNKKQIDDFSKVGIKALNDTTLQIKLGKPTPYFLSLLYHHSWFPVHKSTIEKFGPFDKRATNWTRPENFVGNGAFTLKEWRVNEVIRVVKNVHYWDSATVKLQEIRFFPIENQQTEEREFQTGKLHVTSNCPLAKIDWYKKNKPEVLRIDPYLGTYFYLVNIAKPPLNDVRVRKALALSIDKKKIVENILKAGQLPGICFTPPNTAGYTCSVSVNFDTIEAKRLLIEAGYGPNKPFPEISILYNTSEQHQIIAQAIQQMWKDHLGIKVGLINQEWKVYLASTHSKNYEIARMGWIGDYNDPNTFLDMWLTGGGNNRAGFSNASYDSLINLASMTEEQPTRYSYFQKAEKILLDNMPILPIYFYTNVYLKDTKVKGWEQNILNLHPYKFVSIE